MQLFTNTIIFMETQETNRKLNRYELSDQIIYTGFADFTDAEDYSKANNGRLIEVVFNDGNDNPRISNDAKLLEKKLHYFVDAGSEYQFIHSSDPGFRDYAEELQKINASRFKIDAGERTVVNFENEIIEDPIIVIKNDEFESVTSRERSKYLKQANVYEIGVSVAST